MTSLPSRISSVRSTPGRSHRCARTHFVLGVAHHIAPCAVGAQDTPARSVKINATGAFSNAVLGSVARSPDRSALTSLVSIQTNSRMYSKWFGQRIPRIRTAVSSCTMPSSYAVRTWPALISSGGVPTQNVLVSATRSPTNTALLYAVVLIDTTPSLRQIACDLHHARGGRAPAPRASASLPLGERGHDHPPRPQGGHLEESLPFAMNKPNPRRPTPYLQLRLRARRRRDRHKANTPNMTVSAATCPSSTPTLNAAFFVTSPSLPSANSCKRRQPKAVNESK